MFLYKDIIEFAKLINEKCKSLSDMKKSDDNNLKNLQKTNENFNNHIKHLKKIKENTSKMLQANGSSMNYDETVGKIKHMTVEKLLEDYTKTNSLVGDINKCISALMYDIPELQNLLNTCQSVVDIINNHPKFKKWAKKSEKYIQNYPLPAQPMSGIHEMLVQYTENEVNLIINKGTGFIHSKNDSIRSAVFYSIYKSTIADKTGYIFNLTEKLNLLNYNMNKLKHSRELIHNEVYKRLTIYQNKLTENEKELQSFPNKSDKRLMNAVDEYFDEASSKVNADLLSAEVYSLNSTFVDWHSKNIKDSANERYMFFSHNGYLKRLSDSSAYITHFKERLLEHYPFLIKENKKGVFYTFPEVININSSSFNYVIDASKVCEMYDKRMLNSFVQNFVASTIANFPAGKTRFLFCDPENTGVFSVFRDIGKIKDAIDVSSYCDYTGSQNDIDKKLDSICLEITDIINHVLIGTNTTLYDHNINNEFNNRPYKFIMIMDFPRQMNARSLESLRNITKNGPRCGIFTVLVNTNTDAMELLNDAERKVAEELIKSPAFFYRNKNFRDVYDNYFVIPTDEIDTTEFGEYTELYNVAAKNSSVIKIDIDSIEGREIDNGGYTIPVGKSTGGKTETIGFYDQCQHFLLSGATGRGKSNALHVIIHNSLKYIKNLDLYLIDFKLGVEFAPYAHMNHPAFKVLAIESAPEFGYSVLTHIKDKISKIGDIFRENQVENWEELYRKTGKVIPITLIIIDEFQHLFDGEYGKECAEIVKYIAKEGRSFNVHLLLATQTVNSLKGLPEEAKQMIFGRIVLLNDDVEYKSMLWEEDKLAKTLTTEAKGLSVIASGKDNQKLVQIALRKPINDAFKEFYLPISEYPNNTKIMLSAVNENPYSIYNKFLNNEYTPSEYCDLVIGDSINLDESDIKIKFNNPDYVPVFSENKDIIQLRQRQNDNVLIVGNDKPKSETLFTLSLICTLMKQISQKKEASITLITIANATDLYNFAMRYPKYIRVYTTRDVLNNAVIDSTEYLFVFGLHSFPSMKFSVTDPFQKVSNENTYGGVTFGNSQPANATAQYISNDGDMFRSAIDNAQCNVIVWHNDVTNLANMFGNSSTFPIFRNKFLHRIGLKMNADDSVKLMESDCCSKLSESAIVYKCVNDEVIMRMYNNFDSKYMNSIINKLNEKSTD
ncbi:MAG: hypothetical protein K2J32_07225 [Ruminococcus sp.]|nr:hypothetical protein [Ruminococcus sp.]